ncbi:MAG: flagellar biosynthetic protein FliR [Armatimonadota bacterium]
MLQAWTDNLAGSLLVLARVAGIFSVAPILGHARVPAQVRIILSVGLTMAVAPLAGAGQELQMSRMEYVALLAREAAIGLAIGYLSVLLISAAQTAGELVDHEIGFGLSGIVDPVTNNQMPVIARFLQMFATMVFLVSGAHHWLIRALADSYRVIGPGADADLARAAEPVTAVFVTVFLTALKIAGPILGVLLLCDICLGLVARTTPQLNLLMVGFPVKIGIGVAAVLVALPVIGVVLARLMTGIYGDAMALARAMGG